MRRKGQKQFSKKPAWNQSFVDGGRQARIEKDPSSDWKNPSWQISLIDKDGPFGWNNVSLSEWERIFNKLTAYERMTWVEIGQAKKGHLVSVGKIIPEAQKRLTELRLDDYSELFSLDINGLPRIWGIRDREILRILWWDPEHRICPSIKKHT